MTESKETIDQPGVNQLMLTGMIAEAKDLRYTPGGIAVWEGMLHHTSGVYEAGALRRVEYDVPAIAFADVALRLVKIPVGRRIRLSGFIAPRSVRTQRLVVHITEFKDI